MMLCSENELFLYEKIRIYCIASATNDLCLFNEMSTSLIPKGIEIFVPQGTNYMVPLRIAWRKQRFHKACDLRDLSSHFGIISVV